MHPIRVSDPVGRSRWATETGVPGVSLCLAQAVSFWQYADVSRKSMSTALPTLFKFGYNFFGSARVLYCSSPITEEPDNDINLVKPHVKPAQANILLRPAAAHVKAPPHFAWVVWKQIEKTAINIEYLASE